MLSLRSHYSCTLKGKFLDPSRSPFLRGLFAWRVTHPYRLFNLHASRPVHLQALLVCGTHLCHLWLALGAAPVLFQWHGNPVSSDKNCFGVGSRVSHGGRLGSARPVSKSLKFSFELASLDAPPGWFTGGVIQFNTFRTHLGSQYGCTAIYSDTVTVGIRVTFECGIRWTGGTFN